MDRYQGQMRYGTNPRPYAQTRAYQERVLEVDNKYPIAMAYVPWQTLEKTLPLCEGLNIGTIFPELDLPFEIGRCARK